MWADTCRDILTTGERNWKPRDGYPSSTTDVLSEDLLGEDIQLAGNPGTQPTRLYDLIEIMGLGNPLELT